MLGIKRDIGRVGNKVSRKSDRTFYAVLAGATLLISGFAATVTGLGTSLSTAHLSAEDGAAPNLTLSQVEPNAASPDQATLATGIAVSLGVAFLPARNKPAAETEIDLQQELAQARAREASARQNAKTQLAAKLARLKLARTLLAAQARSKAAQTSVTVAALQATGTSAEATADVIAKPAEIVVASLSASVPVKPGAILPPTPDVKPEPPRRSKPETATRPSPEPEQDASPVLAYARPGNPQDDENGVFGGLGKLFGGTKGMPGPSSKVAVYDISAATVHMPDGTKLEAHSGIGHRMDNPKYAHVRMAGPTPPNIYRLRMRESLFHGVEAIRMLPTDRAAMKGRDGMLTHTRLLRRSIGSHGCVAFKDYNKFLNAFKRGKVKTMIVVPSIEKLPTYLAKLERGAGA
ncbi:DUF2778 domain-containing protein [Roseibium sediminicola]|uniref:DUF2778 domain-containing protein n=1 Tax=Roseibium sediminicola TaxID=2933272 RepID=A0ABT0GSJ7_9HYPH|nr:DUF2778 domain-containing protein [Roseibium sp. CAU 1639]MCK7612210.1 DUF2778 domain-containing protein [Roseibium sp. CAU 1639]